MANRTPLYEEHVRAGGKIVEFAGFEMPVQYAGVKAEHLTVRNKVGLFDVSHMGEIRVSGPGSLQLLQKVTTNNVARLADGQAHYTCLTTPQGTVIDDLLVYRISESEYLLCVNAANADGDYEWIHSHAFGDVEVENVRDDWAQIAIQGPNAVELVGRLTDEPLEEIGYYWHRRGIVAGVECLISRTGYTGEDGFELYMSPDGAVGVWRELMTRGEDLGVAPAGLGARDTLRLEAGMALYGHELDRETTPIEARLGWIVKLKKGDFLGREVLLEQRRNGPPKRLIGLRMLARGIPRQGYPLLHQDRPVGQVTSGTMSPYLEEAIGMGYVPPELAEPGTRLQVEIRGRAADAEVVGLPFYKRERPSD